MEALFFTDKQQVYKVRLAELEDGKVAQMGIYLPGRLGMDEGENILSMVITGDYSGYMLFFFAGGKCAKIPLSSYATKQNRRKLLKAYCDKEPLAKLLFLPGGDGACHPHQRRPDAAGQHVLFCVPKENQKSTSDFDALDPRERGCSPLSDPEGEVETEKS